MANDTKAHWTEQRSHYWQRNAPKWEKARRVYESDISLLREMDLVQRKQGESDEQFDERKKTSDFQPLFGSVIDRMKGRVMSLETTGRVERQFRDVNVARGLGDPADPDTPAYRLWRDVDGEGTNYQTLLEDACIGSLVYMEVWAIVEGGTDTRSQVRIIDPLSVVNVFPESGPPEAVLVRHFKDARASIEDPVEEREHYTLYTFEGFEEWEVVETVNEKTGETEKEVRSLGFTPYGKGKPFQWYKTRARRQPILPIFQTVLPIRRNAAYLWAEKNVVHFNRESLRDNILQIASTPLLMLVGTDDEIKAIKKVREQGANVLQLNPQSTHRHDFIAPPSDPAMIATEVLKAKEEDYAAATFQSYADSIRGAERTATEVRQDSTGEEAILTAIATALDEFENALLWRIEQAEFPEEPDLWGQAHVRRTKNFAPRDEQAEVDRKIQRYKGHDPLVLTEDAEYELTRKAYEQDGLPVPEVEGETDELRETIRQKRDQAAQAGQIPSASSLINRFRERVNQVQEPQ